MRSSRRSAIGLVLALTTGLACGSGIDDQRARSNDGVCDCLNVATIGRLGIWSSGTGVFADWLRRRSPTGAVALGDQPITPERLKPFQVIVLLNVASVWLNLFKWLSPPKQCQVPIPGLK